MNAHTQNEGSVADIEDMTVDAAQIEPLTADSETESPVEPRANRFRAGDWSNTRALIVGGIFGALLGAVFFGGYAAASAWICSANLNCGHWAPIAI